MATSSSEFVGYFINFLYMKYVVISQREGIFLRTHRKQKVRDRQLYWKCTPVDPDFRQGDAGPQCETWQHSFFFLLGKGLLYRNSRPQNAMIDQIKINNSTKPCNKFI